MTPSNKLIFTKEEFSNTIKNCCSLRNVCEHYNKPSNGYYTKLFRKWIDMFECDTSHFNKSIIVSIICSECGKSFEVVKSKVKIRKFCSLTCANQKVRGRALPLSEDQLFGDRKHRRICFRYHKKECIVCKEQLAVTVHHYNGNHSDDCPDNLVPLCAKHHIYVHSKDGQKIVKPIVDVYVENFKRERRLKDRILPCHGKDAVSKSVVPANL